MMMQQDRDALLMEYAAGTLDHAHHILVACYLTLSPEARRIVQNYETLGAALMDCLCDDTTLSDDCLERVLAKIDAATQQEDLKPSACPDCLQDCPLVPQPLARHLATTQQKCRRGFGGLQWMTLPFADSHHIVQIARCRPGFVLPHHAHRGQEITLVLDGSLTDATGHYRRGDLMIMQENSDHYLAADAQQGCLLFSITSAPIRFTGLWMRFFNPFM